MESRFGVNFSTVKVHTDTKASELARALNAEAFTYGREIYFGRRWYSPQASSSKRLLAHELTHVVQQNRSASVQSNVKPLSGLSVSFASKTLQRFVSPAMCAPDKISSVNVDSYRARGMLLRAGAKLSAYSVSAGLWPSSVRSAMSRHFGTTIPQFLTDRERALDHPHP